MALSVDARVIGVNNRHLDGGTELVAQRGSITNKSAFEKENNNKKVL